jgi:uncharacterized protein (DUF58 family)
MLVRQFETEAQRELRLVVDSTTSMGYRGESSAISKLRYASIVSAALSRVAILGGDAVSLAVLGTGWKQGVAKRSGQEHFERILAKLESLEAQGDALADPSIVVRPLAQLSNRSSRGTVTVVLSDFLDWPNDVHSLLSGSCGHQRTMIMLQILEPDEVSFPFDSSIRLRGMEGRDVVETNGSDVRLGYLAALEQSQRQWQTFITSKGGKWLSCQSNDDPVTVVRRILEMAR